MATRSTTRAGIGPWRGAAALAGLGGLLALTPPGLAEALYARGLYPSLQPALTGASNLLPFAVFDVVLVALVAALLVIWHRGLRRVERQRVGTGRAIVVALVRTVAIAAAAVVWFQLAWGLNYARPPVDVRLALPAGAPTADEVAGLLQRAVSGANADHAAAHVAGFPAAHDIPGPLVTALHEVEHADGGAGRTTAGRPKSTLLGAYFRAAGVDGLTAPAMLETLLNPDLVGPERPFVLAHEWAHLAGYAPEADANFVAWRACARADVASRYSGWLFLLSEASRQVPRDVRQRALAALAAGPRADLDAIARRAAARIDVVQRLGWRVYDGYLRSQGVVEGVASYSRVVELVVRAERRSSRGSSRP